MEKSRICKSMIIILMMVIFLVGCGSNVFREDANEIMKISDETVIEEEKSIKVETTVGDMSNIKNETVVESVENVNDESVVDEVLLENEENIKPITKSTYRTKWNDMTTLGDTFLFDYPSDWKIIQESVQDYDTIAEQVVLSNERGIEIYYMNYRNLNGNARHMYEIEINKVADSEFVPGYPAECDVDYSFLGNFMVGEIKIIGEMNIDIDSDYQKIDGGTFYAVMPECMEGKHSDIRNVMLDCSFDYNAKYAFIAMSPDGKFLEEEKRAVTKILSSFRLE